MKLGIHGDLGAGKDTAADYLVDRFVLEKVTFAENFKRMCSDVFGVKLESFYDRDLKEALFEVPIVFSRQYAENMAFWIQNNNDIKFTVNIFDKILRFDKFGFEMTSPRVMMQFIGTEFLQTVYGRDYHVRVLFNRTKDKSDFVVADVRFETEVSELKKNGFKVISIRRSNNPFKKTTSGLSGHRSENDLDGKDHLFDSIIMNDGSLDELYVVLQSEFIKLREEFDHVRESYKEDCDL